MLSEEYLSPIFHFSDDVECFESVEAMCRYVEPWDADDGEAFDANSRRIALRGVGVRRTGFTVGNGLTTVDLDASGDRAPDRLVELLRDYISRVGALRAERPRPPRPGPP